jgi:hypothetical protein
MTKARDEKRGALRRLLLALRHIHASDLRKSDLGVLNSIEKEIARIYDELGEGRRNPSDSPRP